MRRAIAVLALLAACGRDGNQAERVRAPADTPTATPTASPAPATPPPSSTPVRATAGQTAAARTPDTASVKLRLEKVADVTQPTAMDVHGSTIYVAEKAGRVVRLQP